MRSSFRTNLSLMPLLGMLCHGAVAAAGGQENPYSLAALIEAGGAYMGLEVCKACHPSQHAQISPARGHDSVYVHPG